MTPGQEAMAVFVRKSLADGPLSRIDIDHRHGAPSDGRWWYDLVDAMVADGQAVNVTCDHESGGHFGQCKVGLPT